MKTLIVLLITTVFGLSNETQAIAFEQSIKPKKGISVDQNKDRDGPDYTLFPGFGGYSIVLVYGDDRKFIDLTDGRKFFRLEEEFVEKSGWNGLGLSVAGYKVKWIGSLNKNGAFTPEQIVYTASMPNNPEAKESSETLHQTVYVSLTGKVPEIVKVVKGMKTYRQTGEGLENLQEETDDLVDRPKPEEHEVEIGE